MSRRLLYIALIILPLSDSLAQDDMQLQMGYRGTVAAARFLPSTQILLDQRFEFSFQYNSWVANKSITFGSIKKIVKENRLTQEDISTIVAGLDENNKIGVGQDFMLFGFGYHSTIKKREVVWNFTITDRLNANVSLPKQLVELVWQGNKQFEGEILDFSETFVAEFYLREFSLGVATEIAKWGDWHFRGGLRLNYYQGLSGVNREKADFLFTTAVDADYIAVDYDFKYFYTGIEDFNFFEQRGNGLGLNLGTSFSYKDVLNFDIGFTDIGSLKFNKKVGTIGSKNNFQFSGLGLDEVINPTAFLDSLETIFTPRIDSSGTETFKMPIGNRLTFMASWVFSRTKKFKHPRTVSLLYTQGFSEHPGVTASPKFTIGVHSPVFRYFILGVSGSLGGFNNYALGGLAGMRFKHYRFSFQSDDITGLIFPNSGTGGGGGFIFQLLF